MSDDAVLRRVDTIVARVAGPARLPRDPTPETPLGEGGYWLDSVDLLEVIVACEQEFGMTFDTNDDLSEKSLSTVRTLTDTITRKTR